MSAKPAIDDKLQGSVATYLTCVGLLITKDGVPVKKFFLHFFSWFRAVD